MSSTKISRRNALGLIARSGATLGAGAAFFVSLRTAPLEAASESAGSLADDQAVSRGAPKRSFKVDEKVLVSGAGSTLVFKISGAPGRHCGVSFADADTRDRYKAAPGGRGVIGANGLCVIELDLKHFADRKLYFRVVTAGSGDFENDRRGTDVFEIVLAKGAISRFGGVRERLLDGASASTTSIAAMCYQKSKSPSR